MNTPMPHHFIAEWRMGERWVHHHSSLFPDFPTALERATLWMVRSGLQWRPLASDGSVYIFRLEEGGLLRVHSRIESAAWASALTFDPRPAPGESALRVAALFRSPRPEWTGVLPPPSAEVIHLAATWIEALYLMDGLEDD